MDDPLTANMSDMFSTFTNRPTNPNPNSKASLGHLLTARITQIKQRKYLTDKKELQNLLKIIAGQASLSVIGSVYHQFGMIFVALLFHLRPISYFLTARSSKREPKRNKWRAIIGGIASGCALMA
jgi:hypothetical protein